MERLSLNRWASPWLRYQHLARYRWVSSMTRSRRVLDAACGTGYGARMLIDNGARRVDGLDNSLQAVEEARRGGESSGLRISVGDVTLLPFRDDSFDFFVCLETVEHVDDDQALVAEAVRVLRPGGKFICSTPNRDLLSPGRTVQDRPRNPFHIREYDREDFQSLLGRFFSTIDLYGQTPFPRFYARWLGRLGRKVPWLAIRCHQARKIVGLPRESPRRHFPRKLPLRGEPEVLIAVCATQSAP